MRLPRIRAGLTRKNAARILGCSERAIRYFEQTKRLKSFKHPGSQVILIDPKSLMKFLPSYRDGSYERKSGWGKPKFTLKRTRYLDRRFNNPAFIEKMKKNIEAVNLRRHQEAVSRARERKATLAK